MTRFREAFPILLVDDVPRALGFYCETFGFEATYRWPPEGEPQFAFLRLEPLGIGLGRRTGGGGDERMALWIYADDVDAAAALLRAAGAEELAAPEDRPWGERVAQFRDRDGHRIVVGASR